MIFFRRKKDEQSNNTKEERKKTLIPNAEMTDDGFIEIKLEDAPQKNQEKKGDEKSTREKKKDQDKDDKRNKSNKENNKHNKDDNDEEFVTLNKESIEGIENPSEKLVEDLLQEKTDDEENKGNTIIESEEIIIEGDEKISEAINLNSNSKKSSKESNERRIKAAVISLGSTSSQWTIEAMKKYFDEVDDVNLKEIEINFSGDTAEVLYKGEPLPKYDCVYVKGSFRYAPLLAGITALIKKHSYVPIREDAFTVVHDKLLTQLSLQQQNIPMPRTYQAATTEAAKSIIKRMNYPIIMKFPHGTQGKGVVVSDSYSSASSVLDAFTALNQPFIIQEFIDTGGEDIRAIVVGNEVVATMKRIAKPDEKRANTHAGGSAVPYELDENTKAMVIKVAKCLGAEICGVDLLMGLKGALVIEANISPGLQGITKASGVNVADHIARYLYEQTLKFLNIKQKDEEYKLYQEMKLEKGDVTSLITQLDFKGSRILLPEVITKVTGFKAGDDFEIKMDKGLLEIKPFKM